jgi:hypothetical protein
MAAVAGVGVSIGAMAGLQKDGRLAKEVALDIVRPGPAGDK